MKKLLVPALWALLVLTILYSIKEAVRAVRETVQWEADTSRVFTQIEVDRIARDSVVAVETREAEARNNLLKLADRRAVAGRNAQREGDSLRRVLQEAQNPSDSLQIALETTERYQVALGEAQGENAALRDVIQSQSLSLVRFKTSEAQAWASIDSLQALMRRKPGGCRLLVIPCPVIVGGASAVLSNGTIHTGAGVTAGWKIRF